MYAALPSSRVNSSALLVCRHNRVTREAGHVGLVGRDRGDFDVIGGQNFPLTLHVSLTTVQHYRGACDYNLSSQTLTQPNCFHSMLLATVNVSCWRHLQIEYYWRYFQFLFDQHNFFFQKLLQVRYSHQRRPAGYCISRAFTGQMPFLLVKQRNKTVPNELGLLHYLG